MNKFLVSSLSAAALVAGTAWAPSAVAATQSVSFNTLVASATVQTPLLGDDTLFVNTLVTSEVGALSQEVTFTLGAGVGSLFGSAAWMVSTATAGPRLLSVNIDIFNASNTLVGSDTLAGPLVAGFAHSTFDSLIGPGTYRLVATGTGVRDSSLDVALTFANAIPEPATYALMLGGIAAICFVMRRRS